MRMLPTAVFILITSATALAQMAPAPGSRNATALAKYDANRNGMLDADELARQRADEAATAGAVELKREGSGMKPGEAVVLTPFEVNTYKDDGFSATNAAQRPSSVSI